MKYEKKKEIWKDIPDYKGYQVSNYGRVRSVDRVIKQFGHKKEYKRTMKGRILKLHKQNGDYLLATLTKNGKEKKMLVHRLVATAFLKENMQINHIDGNKSNNNANNLEWCTQSENVKHSYSMLNHKRKVKKIYCVELDKHFNSIAEASLILNINRSSISHAINNKAKTAGGYKWKII